MIPQDSYLKELFTNELAESWLLQKGHISDVSKNKLIMGLYGYFNYTTLVEFDISEHDKLFDARIYIKPLKLFFMTIFFRRNKVLTELHEFIDSFLLGVYDVRVTVLPYRANRNQSILPEGQNEQE